MELIKKLGTRKCKTGNSTHSWGLFLCPFCNKEVEMRLSSGSRGKSCGCATAKFIKTANTKHGCASRGNPTSLYMVWLGMKKRCYSPSNASYKDYGGRGIVVCDEWKNDYLVFKAWAMVNDYQDDLMIDRKDNDGNYTPDNCRFVTMLISNRNKRNVKLNFEKAEEIRRKHKTGNYTREQLGKEYNISNGHVGSIISNESWIKES